MKIEKLTNLFCKLRKLTLAIIWLAKAIEELIDMAFNYLNTGCNLIEQRPMES